MLVEIERFVNWVRRRSRVTGQVCAILAPVVLRGKLC